MEIIILNKYLEYLKDFETHKIFSKQICKNSPLYISVINNCENKEFTEIPKFLTNFDLNRKNVSCPNTFYKQEGFYTFESLEYVTSGGYNKNIY